MEEHQNRWKINADLNWNSRAGLMHGHGVYIFLADAEQSAGSDWSLEILSRSLDKTFAKCQRANEPWPNHLKLFTDNTPKET